MHFDGVARQFRFEAKHQSLEVGFGDDASGAQDQSFEDRPLAAGQLDALAGQPGAARRQVDLDPAEGQPRRRAAGATPAHRPQPRRQFFRGERFDEVVVGAAVEALNTVAEQVARGQQRAGQPGQGRVQPGELALLMGIGSGLNCTMMGGRW